jgi:putative multiple sugar transport system substrate-binding protein
LAIGFTMAAPVARAQDKGMVGVAMPTKSSTRWISDGNSMVAALAAKGYKADLQFADDDIPKQLAQIENMITKGVKVLVIAAIDGSTLSNALQKAADKGIKVVAYDRLIVGSKNVDYYATFDNFQVGVLQAQSLDHRHAFCEETWRSTFNEDTFDIPGAPKEGWKFEIGLNIIIGIAERNLCLMTQLVRK